MKFELTEKEVKKYNEWKSKHEDVYTGAIGGRYTFSFTPTSLGMIASVTDAVSKEELTLTDFDNF